MLWEPGLLPSSTGPGPGLSFVVTYLGRQQSTENTGEPEAQGI